MVKFKLYLTRPTLELDQEGLYFIKVFKILERFKDIR